MRAVERYACPCCGYLSFSEWPGSYEVCHICYWEDDPVQALDPTYAGGANRPSLFEAQSNYRKYGAMEERFVKHVRGIQPDDEQDAQWRPLADGDRKFRRAPADLSDEEHRDLNVWYYWRQRRA